jgi:hypothetical protein
MVKLSWVTHNALHRLAVASPVRGASKLPPTPPRSGRLRTPLNPIDHAPTALKGVPAPWNPDHFMETKRAYPTLWKPTTNPVRFGCSPWYSPMETISKRTYAKNGRNPPPVASIPRDNCLKFLAHHSKLSKNNANLKMQVYQNRYQGDLVLVARWNERFWWQKRQMLKLRKAHFCFLWQCRRLPPTKRKRLSCHDPNISTAFFKLVFACDMEC